MSRRRWHSSGKRCRDHQPRWGSVRTQSAGAITFQSGAVGRCDNAGTFRKSLDPGTVLCTGSGGFYGSSGSGVIANRAGALFEVRNNASFTHGLASCRFDNAGTFRKNLTAGTNTFSGAFAFNNYGTVDLRSGILAANGGYNSGTGDYSTVPSPARFRARITDGFRSLAPSR